MEKKCQNCGKRDMCVVYWKFIDMASLLNVNLFPYQFDQLPSAYLINKIAHKCKHFNGIE